MTTDTARKHWNTEWAEIAPDSKWLTPEPDMIRWVESLPAGGKVLDLGAGVGRHALELARRGFTVTASDAAAEGLAVINQAGLGVETIQSMMSDLPFEDGCFDHVISWNVIYHGDHEIVSQSIAEIARVLKPGGTYLGTMLSKRRLPHEQAKLPGTEVSHNTWNFDDGGTGDKRHPHYFCNAAELVDLFSDFELMWLEDREHEKQGSWHWHLIAERLA